MQDACVNCGSPQTRIVGQSGSPPLVHRRCEACGYLWSRDIDGGNGARTPFRSPEHRFEVMFHATPEVQEERTPSGRAAWIYTDAATTRLFQVRVTEAPPHMGSAVDFLHRTLSVLAGTMTQPNLTRLRNEDHKGFPALRFSFTSAGRQGEGILILRRATVFTIVAIDDSIVGVDRSRFVESFSCGPPEGGHD